jgi:glucan phosphoethanolaminetransferase (alkaline phosphatase superfamily)
MSNRLFTPIVLTIIGLAILGIASNPAGLLKQLVIIAIIVLVFYLLYKMFTHSNNKGSNGKASYNRAARKSAKKYAVGKQESNSSKKVAPIQLLNPKANTIKKRKQTHLTVIEGKKGKKKDRASF